MNNSSLNNPVLLASKLVESGESGSGWYRVYEDSDGKKFLIQSGRVGATSTATLLKQYGNTNYNAFVNNNYSAEAYDANVYSRTATTIKWTAWGGSSYGWLTIGYMTE